MLRAYLLSTLEYVRLTNLSKGMLGLKQIFTQFLTPFSCTVFNILSLLLSILFVFAYLPRNHSLTGRNYQIVNPGLEIRHFEKNPLAQGNPKLKGKNPKAQGENSRLRQIKND